MREEKQHLRMHRHRRPLLRLLRAPCPAHDRAELEAIAPGPAGCTSGTIGKPGFSPPFSARVR